jgi:hypothetical protein
MKQETLEEASINYVLLLKENNNGYVPLNLPIKEIFKAGAKWQAERLYSEEEVYSLLEQSMKDCHLWELEEHSSMGDYINLKEWFEEFKKK